MMVMVAMMSTMMPSVAGGLFRWSLFAFLWSPSRVLLTKSTSLVWIAPFRVTPMASSRLSPVATIMMVTAW